MDIFLFWAFISAETKRAARIVIVVKLISQLFLFYIEHLSRRLFPKSINYDKILSMIGLRSILTLRLSRTPRPKLLSLLRWNFFNHYFCDFIWSFCSRCSQPSLLWSNFINHLVISKPPAFDSPKLFQGLTSRR